MACNVISLVTVLSQYHRKQILQRAGFSALFKTKQKTKRCFLHLCSSLFVQFQLLHVPWSLWICAQAEVNKDKHVGIPTFMMKERYLPSYPNYANVITDLISVLFVCKYIVWERNCHEAIFSRTLLLWDMKFYLEDYFLYF